MKLAPRRRPTIHLGTYEALEPLGEGGMGKVFLGKHTQTGQKVVIKVMHDHLVEDARQRQRFNREMQFMMSFRHPHAVALLDGSFGHSTDGPPCIVMEYVDGVTLEKLIEQHERLPPIRVGKFLVQLCSVLHAAHGAGMLHRDLSANNVMISEPNTRNEQVKVMDFGLANLDTRTGGFYIPIEKLDNEVATFGPGTPDYISPEQLRGEEVDHRSDLYSVGVLLFQALTGQVPYQEFQEVEQVLDAQINRAPPRFASIGVRSIPSAVEAVVQCCLSKNPAERPQSARELAELFEASTGAVLITGDVFSESPQKSINPRDTRDPATVCGNVQAWMPEQIAVMKLQAFVSAVGGEIVESLPGIIRVTLPDPRCEPPPDQSGFLSFLGLGRKTLPQKLIHLELHMEKKTANGQSLVDISLVLIPEKGMVTREDEHMRQGFGQRIFRELCAYLVTGR